MKLVFASDIHGSAYYCEKVIEAYKKEGAERLILLGDLLYHGPRNDLPREYEPKKVTAMLNDMKNEIFAVRGNCEAEVDQMVLHFPIMADYALLPVGSNVIYMTHGHHANEQSPPPLKKGDFLLCGHTHVPAHRAYDNFMYLNPGSVSIPKEGSCRSYMTFDGTHFTWKKLDDGRVYDEI